MDQISFVSIGTNLALSMSTGVVIGLERQINNVKDHKQSGMRDFALVAVLAFVSSLLYEKNALIWPIAFISVVAYSLVMEVFENMRKLPEQGGITTILALPVTFLVASLPNFDTQFWVIATLVVTVLTLLDLKEQLHLFSATIDRREMIDFATLIVISITITPLIPPGAELPVPMIEWANGAFSLSYQGIAVGVLWKVVIMVSLMSFTAHFITKYIKGRNALVLASFFGGLVSSLATIILLLRNEQSGQKLSPQEVFLGYVAANTGSIIKDLAVLWLVIGPKLFALLVFPLVSILALFASFTAFAFSKSESHEIRITNRPLPLSFVSKFSGTFAMVMIFMMMVTHHLGSGATVVATFLSGMISSAAALASLGTSVQHGGLSVWTLGISILAALLGSISAKYMVIAKHMGFRESAPFFLPVLSLAGVGLLVMWINLPQ